MQRNLPDFLALAAQEHAKLGQETVHQMLEQGRAWDLAPTLQGGGAIIFPHVGLRACGHQIAAAVHACLDSGADRVLVLGTLHALTDALEEARVRVASGGDVTIEPAWGVQGPGLPGREDWRNEFSLSHFQFMWQTEIARRGIQGPQLLIRYPYLAGGKPEILPGIEELEGIASRAVVVATMDPFHHGIGYGEPPETALAAEEGGLDLARKQIERGLALLKAGDYWGYNGQSVEAKSDGRDVGQVLRYLQGPLDGRILDLVADDMTSHYNQPAPTWVAGALIEMTPARDNV